MKLPRSTCLPYRTANRGILHLNCRNNVDDENRFYRAQTGTSLLECYSTSVVLCRFVSSEMVRRFLCACAVLLVGIHDSNRFFRLPHLPCMRQLSSFNARQHSAFSWVVDSTVRYSLLRCGERCVNSPKTLQPFRSSQAKCQNVYAYQTGR